MADALNVSIREEQTPGRKPGKITVTQSVVTALVVIALFVASSLGVSLDPEATAGVLGIILTGIAWFSKGRVVVETQEKVVQVPAEPVGGVLTGEQWDASKLIAGTVHMDETAVSDGVDPALIEEADKTFGK